MSHSREMTFDPQHLLWACFSDVTCVLHDYLHVLFVDISFCYLLFPPPNLLLMKEFYWRTSTSHEMSVSFRGDGHFYMFSLPLACSLSRLDPQLSLSSLSCTGLSFIIIRSWSF